MEAAPIIGPGSIELSDDIEWALRNEHWLTQYDRSVPRRRVHERAQNTLVLCGHGVLR
jgi:hypothetical protein